jgi:hypothetical protein
MYGETRELVRSITVDRMIGKKGTQVRFPRRFVPEVSLESRD